MKQLLLVLIGGGIMAACNNGNRDYNMETNTSSPSDTNNNVSTTFDTSARDVQDTSTVIGYDTAARKQ